MGFKLLTIASGSTDEVIQTSTINTEAVVSNFISYNSNTINETFTLKANGITIIKETVPANSSYRLTDKFNIPINTILTADTDANVTITASVYEQAIDVTAANSSLQALASTMEDLASTMEDFNIASVATVTEKVDIVTPHFNNIETVVENMDIIAIAKDNADAATRSRNESADSAYMSAASSNNKGEWANLTGSLSVPASVNYKKAIWVLNVDVADVTLSEPNKNNTDWLEFAGGQIFDFNGGGADEIYSSADIDLDSGGL